MAHNQGSGGSIPSPATNEFDDELCDMIANLFDGIGISVDYIKDKQAGPQGGSTAHNGGQQGALP